MKPNSIAIFPSNLNLPENGDAQYAFRPNSDILWLSGIRQEKTMVVLYPDNPDVNAREILVLLRPNEHLEKWEGHKLRKEEATAISGIKNVQWSDTFDAQLHVMMHQADVVYLNSNENDRLDLSIPRLDLAYVTKIKEQYPLHQYERAAKITRELRAIKTKEEIAVTQEAVDITEKAFRRVMQFIKPGVMEYEIEAEITHEFLRNRATRHAYGNIIASGDRARILHYVENNQVCKNGELILMDFGAEYGNYCADMTRTIPVNGKFTKRQKEVYNACLHLHDYAKSILKPGISILKYTDKVGEEATKQFLKIGLLSKADIKNEDPTNPAYRKYLYHGISHHLGIDVHDLGTRTAPIQAGMVFTVEPGIYIKEEAMGVRIENNVWVTKTGNQDLFKNIPIKAEEIEALMRRKK
jgi:Xaa-Pro aminopeptidase